MSRCIDADALEKEGWSLHRTIRVDKYTSEYQTKPLRQVPTIEPEPHWIPCCERLPKKSGQYYVTGGGKVWICEFLIIPNFTGGWCNDVANPVVQAWMPIELPEPYKEGEG